MHIRPYRLTSAIATLALAILMFGPAPQAWAHDQLISSSPQAGAVVEKLDKLTLVFSDKVIATGTQAQLTDAVSGKQVATSTTVSGDTLTVSVTGEMQPGSYKLTWRVTSADGHPVTGVLPFTQAVASSSPGSPTTSSAALSKTSAASASSSSPTPPAQQVPSKKTDNYPVIVLGGVVVLLALIGAGVVLAKRRLKDD